MLRIFTVLFALTIISYNTNAQDYELKGSAEVYKDLLKMHRGLRVLYLAAHPDDENTRLIAWLENEKNIETAYLSLTRGQGGQNLIGDEKGDALGVIRTYELLEARKIDGGEQMFTRAVDFGYSKSAKESFEKWGKDEVLADVVYAIRKYRPQIIVTRFPPDRNAGHGHHEASAILAAEAFDLAGDKSAYTEQFDRVEIWQPQSLYFNTSSWWRKELADKSDEELKDEKILKVNVGVYNPISGLGVNEIASLARSKHRCQAFGTSRDRGERFEYLQLLKGDWNDDLFDGYEGIWASSPEHKDALKTMIDNYSFVDQDLNYDLFVTNFERKMAQRNMWAQAQDMKYVVEMSKKVKQNLLGVRIEVYADKDPVVIGRDYPVTIDVYNGGSKSANVRFSQPEIDTTFDIEAGMAIQFTRLLKAPNDVSTPYWLREPHDELYVLSDDMWLAEPKLKDQQITYTIKRDIPVKGTTELHRKWTDRSIGEVIQPMQYVPSISISNRVNTLIIQGNGDIFQNLDVYAYEDIENLQISPSGLENDPNALKGISLTKGQQTTHSTNWQSGSEPNESRTISSTAFSGNNTYDLSIQTIEYEHIPNVLIAKPCQMKLIKLDLKMEEGLLLYIQGSGDEVDESLESIGYQVDRKPLSEVSDNLGEYKAIIIGIRAYNTNDELVAYQPKLMEYVKNGGNVIVQYNTSRGLKSENFGPYPFTLGRERVTEEDAKATLIEPEHDVFNKPNELNDSDFDDWVQERGLYFAQDWSDEYVPLISWKDSGEKFESKGGLIVAKYGKGSLFYSGISFFRQLPAGVPGAYRLLVNMIEYAP